MINIFKELSIQIVEFNIDSTSFIVKHSPSVDSSGYVYNTIIVEIPIEKISLTSMNRLLVSSNKIGSEFQTFKGGEGSIRYKLV